MPLTAPTLLSPEVKRTTATALVSGSFTPAAGALVIVSVTWSGDAAATASGGTLTSTITGVSDWSQIAAAPGAVASQASAVFYTVAGASPSSGTVTVTLPASPTASSIAVSQITGSFGSTTYGSYSSGYGGGATPIVGAVTGLFTTTSQNSLTLGVTPTVDDLALGVFGSRNRTSAQTPGTGFTALLNGFNTVAPSAAHLVEYRSGADQGGGGPGGTPGSDDYLDAYTDTYDGSSVVAAGDDYVDVYSDTYNGVAGGTASPNVVTATQGTSYSANIAFVVQSTPAVTTPVSRSVTGTWTVNVAGSATTGVFAVRLTTWVTRAQVVTSAATGWSLQSLGSSVLAQRGTSWVTRAQVVSDPRGTSWTILVGGSSASASRSTSWGVGAGVVAIRTTGWAIFSDNVSPTATTPGLRLRVYAPNGADLGPLPTPEGVSVSYPLNDVGGLSLSYSARAPRADLLGQPCEIAVEISPDGGVSWAEPLNSRFVYVSDGRDPLDRADKYTAEAKSYVWRFSKARVLPNGLLNNDGKRAFLSASPGTILKTLLNEATSRGALTGISHSSFTTGLDSAGAAWASTITIYYEPGLDYLALLTNLADQGFVDFRMQGRALHVYNAGSTMARDLTVGSAQVIFRGGRDLTDAPFRRTWESLADYAYFAGDSTAKYEYTNPTAVKPWGRQETFISNGSVSDPGTMAVLTQAELALTDHERTEYTRGLDFTRAASVPFWNYNVGDYVWSAVGGEAPAKLRLRQLTLTRDELGRLGGNVVLNDRFLEADIRAKRRIEGIVNGASSGPGDGGGGEPPGTDTIAPGVVGGLGGSSAAYMGPGGFAQAQVTLSWAAPATNVDGTPLEDLSQYEVFQRPQISNVADLRQRATTTDTSIDLSPYVTGSSWRFTVRAVDNSGNRGAFCPEISVGMAQDTTPPQAPSAPVATARLGIVSARWDGNPSTGTWGPDFDHVEVHVSTVNSFTPSDATMVDTLFGEGVAIIAGAAFGVPLFIKLIAVDKAGLKSVPSAQATATPSRLVGTDLDPGAITYEQIAFKNPGNIVPDGSFETVGFRSNLLFRSASAWTFTTADNFHGDYSATIDASVNAATTRHLVLMAPTEVQQIQDGEKLFCRFAYKGTAGATGVVQLVALWVLRDGSTFASTLPGAVKNGTWQQAAGQLSAPAGVQDFRIYMELSNTGTTGTYWVDAVEVRRTVGTAIIEDAAIKNAQIDTLAVNSAQISGLDVGKLTAGQLNADVLIASRLMTATSGNRIEMSGTGIRMFRGTTLTGWWRPDAGQLRIYGGGDVTATSTDHGLQFGDDNNYNLVIDENEIMARFNGQYSPLHLNLQGGDVYVGTSVVATDLGLRSTVVGTAQPMRTRDLVSYSDITVTSTTPEPNFPELNITFTCPASSRIMIGAGGTAAGNATGTCMIGMDIRNGTAGGTQRLGWDSGNAFAVRGVDLMTGMMWTHVEGLTPGAVYTTRCLTQITGGTGHAYFRKIIVVPLM